MGHRIENYRPSETRTRKYEAEIKLREKNQRRKQMCMVMTDRVKLNLHKAYGATRWAHS